ncbi:aromatic compound dioxygenase [Aspergillus sclerotiicarbonarius CBS 121057]|uniref:Aromatic compound dioxygenase n=1 Tax=Aspergillus sclerotiicarbonarius (strain CBS 121057 / IBT 28362) TaxID=1448318 RepID=A0A319ELP3_ASPSB|nr:aromatic compound dioxygenase [Aspergillus sclerotiicarbonarius CBS 121057]
MFYSKLIVTALAATAAIAHPGPHDILPRGEIQRRSNMAKRCAEHVGNFNQQRMAKRAMHTRKRSGHNTTFEITTEAPYYETIQNDTCVLTPEVTRGPYVWPRSQTLRQDMTEDQVGIPLWLDVGVLDMATCEPLPNALLDFWHCNATGSYSSFTHLSPNTPFEDLLSELNITRLRPGCHRPAHRRYHLAARHVAHQRERSFYVDRAIHIHVQVHTDWSVRENGTIIAGNTVSTGQIYFDEEVEEKLMTVEPYASHTQINRTTNADDSVFFQDTEGGYSPVVSVVPVDGEDLANDRH